MENYRILVVDDEASMRDVLSIMLHREGYQVDTAVDGAQAVTHLRDHTYDLVISDIKMPRMTGLELLKAVRASDDYKDIPFLMVTAEAQKQNVLDAVQAGVSNYVNKPFTAEQISDKLEKMFG